MRIFTDKEEKFLLKLIDKRIETLDNTFEVEYEDFVAKHKLMRFYTDVKDKIKHKCTVKFTDLLFRRK